MEVHLKLKSIYSLNNDEKGYACSCIDLTDMFIIPALMTIGQARYTGTLYSLLCSTLVTFCALNITRYQRTLLGTSANQKRHYLKSYNKSLNCDITPSIKSLNSWLITFGSRNSSMKKPRLLFFIFKHNCEDLQSNLSQ
jgi:hypothetical protein